MIPLRDPLSLRLTNRATLLRMAAAGELPAKRAELRALLLEIADDIQADARAAGLLEVDRERTA